MPTFFEDLATVSRPDERGHHRFVDAAGATVGFIQLVTKSERRIAIHRIWTLAAGKGHGSRILQTLCEIADRHGVEIMLKVIPIGRKPYPLSREQLFAWYQRHGFEGTRRKMIRLPQPVA